MDGGSRGADLAALAVAERTLSDLQDARARLRSLAETGCSDRKSCSNTFLRGSCRHYIQKVLEKVIEVIGVERLGSVE